MIDNLKEVIAKNKTEIKTAFISTFIWGIIAHFYMFVNTALSHDCLEEFIYLPEHKIKLGRFIAALKVLITSNITLNWLIGIISLIFLSLAVFGIIKLFNIKSKTVITLIAGILTVNISIISIIATYMHDLDTYAFAILLSIVMVYCWKNYKHGYLYGMFIGMLVLGIYQAYISIPITLIMMLSIMNLLNGADYKEVLKNGLKGIAMIIGSGLLYLIILKIVTTCMNITLRQDSYNSLSAMSFNLGNLIKAYCHCIYNIFTATSIYHLVFSIIIHVVLAISLLIILIKFLSNKKYNAKTKAMIIILLLVLPFGMNVTYIIDGGFAHDIMQYSFWFIYFFVIILAYESVSKKTIKRNNMYIIASILVFVILLGNVKLANAIYLKKNIEKDATLSYMTRVLGNIETYEEYKQGETEVIFVGIPSSLKNIPGFENCYKITGCENTSAISLLRKYYQAYFDYVLLNPIKLADQEEWDKIIKLDEINNMPSYPEKGYIAKIDNRLVVKLGYIDKDRIN